ncbi:uncharacterized protein LOC115258094 [Aedes albopictus]|uniref:Secreted protein n=1 Tax=Aedes albopictus TaxID=7160 RepID=A0ABM1Y8N4_AEDAL
MLIIFILLFPVLLFFWKNAGKGPNYEHSGLIQSHLRNMSKKLTPEQRKFTHKKKDAKVCSVPSEIIEQAEECARKDSIPANFTATVKCMDTTHSLFTMMLQEKKSLQSILQAFPHFKLYDGLLIQKAYERMTPNYDKNSNLIPILARGLMVETEMFAGIQDDNLRGCLRIMVRLKNRSLKSQARGPNDDLNVEDQLSSDLIRFVPETETSLEEQLARYVAFNHEHDTPVAPHLICKAGKYHLYIAGDLIELGEASVQALDVFLSVFLYLISPYLLPYKNSRRLPAIRCGSTAHAKQLRSEVKLVR